MKRLEREYLLNDEVYYSQHVSAVLTIEGELVYLVQTYDDYIRLKKQVTVTHRILSLEPCCAEMHKCELIGTDGSIFSFYMNDDDIHHNLQFTENQMQIQNHLALVA